jgi:hypothetical protein
MIDFLAYHIQEAGRMALDAQAKLTAGDISFKGNVIWSPAPTRRLRSIWLTPLSAAIRSMALSVKRVVLMALTHPTAGSSIPLTEPPLLSISSHIFR